MHPRSSCRLPLCFKDRNNGPPMSTPCPAASKYARNRAAVCGIIASASLRPPLRITRSESWPRFLMQIADPERSGLGASQPHLQAHGKDARSRTPTVVSECSARIHVGKRLTLTAF
jgi:hypothetical protein